MQDNMSPPNIAEHKVKVSNLPLLFAKGSPTSLEVMNLEELQNFLRFVLKCEQNLSHPITHLDSLEQPDWWPPDLPFTEAVLRDRTHRGKLSVQIRTAVRNCYSAHNCAFLIDFCRKLIDYTGGVENLEVKENHDGTRSLIKRFDRKLLVTFKSENQDYDQNCYQEGRMRLSPIKPLDPRRLVKSCSDNSSDPALSTIQELYLCDTCDSNFESFNLLLIHEKSSHPPEAAAAAVIPSAAAAPAAASTANSNSNINSFLAYLKLGVPGSSPPPSRHVKVSEPPRVTTYEFMNIELSSPMGTHILTSSSLYIDKQSPSSRGFVSIDQYLQAIEDRCPATIKNLQGTKAFVETRAKFSCTHRSTRKQMNQWCHMYSFTPLQRRIRLREIENGLTMRSMSLFWHCSKKKLFIRLSRLSPDIVEKIKKRDEDREKERLTSAREMERLTVAREKEGQPVAASIIDTTDGVSGLRMRFRLGPKCYKELEGVSSSRGGGDGKRGEDSVDSTGAGTARATAPMSDAVNVFMDLDAVSNNGKDDEKKQKGEGHEGGKEKEYCQSLGVRATQTSFIDPRDNQMDIDDELEVEKVRVKNSNDDIICISDDDDNEYYGAVVADVVDNVDMKDDADDDCELVMVKVVNGLRKVEEAAGQSSEIGCLSNTAECEAAGEPPPSTNPPTLSPQLPVIGEIYYNASISRRGTLSFLDSPSPTSDGEDSITELPPHLTPAYSSAAPDFDPTPTASDPTPASNPSPTPVFDTSPTSTDSQPTSSSKSYSSSTGLGAISGIRVKNEAFLFNRHPTPGSGGNCNAATSVGAAAGTVGADAKSCGAAAGGVRVPRPLPDLIRFHELPENTSSSPSTSVPTTGQHATDCIDLTLSSDDEE